MNDMRFQTVTVAIVFLPPLLELEYSCLKSMQQQQPSAHSESTSSSSSSSMCVSYLDQSSFGIETINYNFFSEALQLQQLQQLQQPSLSSPSSSLPSSSSPIVKLAWHPLSSNHIAVLTADNQFQ
jgi:hypothetical protein